MYKELCGVQEPQAWALASNVFLSIKPGEILIYLARIQMNNSNNNKKQNHVWLLLTRLDTILGIKSRTETLNERLLCIGKKKSWGTIDISALILVIQPATLLYRLFWGYSWWCSREHPSSMLEGHFHVVIMSTLFSLSSVWLWIRFPLYIFALWVHSFLVSNDHFLMIPSSL